VVLLEGVSPQITRRLASSLAACTCAAVAATAGTATVAAASVAAPAWQRPAPITVSPAPGTPDASPATQISILGVAPERIRSARVSGSLSGLHRGAFHSYSGRRGASFVLRRPLDEGEHVSVLLGIAGHSPIRFSFGVARLAPTPPIINIPTIQPDKLDHFVSEPQLLPPRIEVGKGGSAFRGDIFLTPLPSPEVHPGSNNAITIKPVGPGGPMIVDGHGRLIWFHQLKTPTVAANFRPQRFGGREVLTWWQGQVTIAAYGLGQGMIFDTAYRPLRTVRAGNGYAADIHEFLLTPSGDALLTVNSLVMLHLPGTAPGKRSPFLDSIVQEVDVRTGLVVWEWHGLGHIPIADSYANTANSPYFDAYHLNSIEPLPGGRVLVSARDTCAVYEIDQATGRVIWTLGGKASSFRMGRGTRFYFQHDATLLPGERVSLFDDEGGPPRKGPTARGLILALDLHRRTAGLAHQYLRPGKPTRPDSEGSFQTLPGGDLFVGFGSTPFFSKFSPAGKLLFDASLPTDDGSYREFNFRWNATPGTRPAISAKRTSATRVSVDASWNGATTVARWQVLAGAGKGSLSPVATMPSRGFETHVAVSSSAAMFAVRALSSTGKLLATSSPVATS
jgi:hypothetical protein